MEAFTELAKEIQNLKDPSMLKEKTARLNELRKSIDQNAPALQQIRHSAIKTRQQYLKTLPQN